MKDYITIHNIKRTIIYKNIIMLYLGDCFEILPSINKKIDLVLVDLPYGQTDNKWDICIDLKKMWIDLKKYVLKIVIMFSRQQLNTVFS
jgi:site-specific DNA-methyltransferase (adenine-specific)